MLLLALAAVGAERFTKDSNGGRVFMKDENQDQPRRAYEPPRVTVISLRPEEAVLGHCKSFSAAGPVGSTCHTTGNCQGIGS